MTQWKNCRLRTISGSISGPEVKRDCRWAVGRFVGDDQNVVAGDCNSFGLWMPARESSREHDGAGGSEHHEGLLFGGDEHVVAAEGIDGDVCRLQLLPVILADGLGEGNGELRCLFILLVETIAVEHKRLAGLFLPDVLAGENDRVGRRVVGRALELAFLAEMGVVHRVVDAFSVLTFAEFIQRAVARKKKEAIVRAGEGFEVAVKIFPCLLYTSPS